MPRRSARPSSTSCTAKAFRREGDLLDLAVNNNIVEKSGSWFSYKGERIGQGRENARQFLKDNKDMMAKLDAEVRKALGFGARSGATCCRGRRNRADADKWGDGPRHYDAECASGAGEGAGGGETVKFNCLRARRRLRVAPGSPTFSTRYPVLQCPVRRFGRVESCLCVTRVKWALAAAINLCMIPSSPLGELPWVLPPA